MLFLKINFNFMLQEGNCINTSLHLTIVFSFFQCISDCLFPALLLDLVLSQTAIKIVGFFSAQVVERHSWTFWKTNKSVDLVQNLHALHTHVGWSKTSNGSVEKEIKQWPMTESNLHRISASCNWPCSFHWNLAFMLILMLICCETTKVVLQNSSALTEFDVITKELLKF